MIFDLEKVKIYFEIVVEFQVCLVKNVDFKWIILIIRLIGER